MAHATNYTIRLDADLRQEAEQLFADLGLNLSTAMNIFLRKAVEVGGIPFEVCRSRPNAETLAAIREAYADSQYFGNHKGHEGHKDCQNGGGNRRCFFASLERPCGSPQIKAD